jgi:uncharacterized protein YqjF (DUF2071 family)
MNELGEARTVRISPSAAARQRLLSLPGEPLFISDWERTLMIHYEVDAVRLQAVVPFAIELHDGRAFVSLVVFTLRGMRPRVGGRLTAWFFKPVATHNFLNVRTYVRHRGEAGIYFLAEWLTNRLSVTLGPRVFGLPYRFGKLCYDHPSISQDSKLRGRVMDGEGKGVFAYEGTRWSRRQPEPCVPGTLDEWLMERYTAFTWAAGKARLFRVWHPPWSRSSMDLQVTDDSLLTANWPFFEAARFDRAVFSPTLHNVWMGRPHRTPLNS